MIKRLFQSLFNLAGYTLVNSQKFGWEPWRDLTYLLGAKTNLTVFDVGAHTGQTLSSIKQHFPSARVCCFEPDPDSFAELETVAKGLSEVTLHQVALGDQNGFLDFHRNKESMTNSLLAAAPEVQRMAFAELMTLRETVSVPVETLDSFCEKSGIPKIDFLKIDCQGYDLRVLQGAGRMLSNKCISVIQCEAIFDPEYVNQGWFYEILGYLTGQGYALCAIHHPARTEHHEITFADAIFTLKA